MKKYIGQHHIIAGFLGLTLLVSFNGFSQNKGKPVPIIFDTDFGPDYDDVGAITLLHAFADNNECEILATVASNSHKRIGSLLQIFNAYFNRPNLTIGVVKGKSVNLGASQKWDSILVERYPSKIKSNDEVEDATKVYRRILASQPDNSVTIVTVGFLTNMANLYNSVPDNFSKLSGKELIKKKVKKLVCMAGRFDNEIGKYKEFNVVLDAASSKIAFDNWPTSIIFTGFEIGLKLPTGIPLINNSSIVNSPVKDAFAISIPKDIGDKNGRWSWDQTAVLIAVRGYEKYYEGVEGKFICNEDGSNQWDANKKGDIYVKEKMPVKEVAALLNELMMHQPVKK
jgi:pyrimidine-specific ribonucleoside hydrolase